VTGMQPYKIYTYFDKKGGRIIGIDLSRKPELINKFPEQHSHEIRLIKKIQAWNLDLQVVVREDGATPDLIVGGVFTELKTRLNGSLSIGDLLEKANSQVASHARRHGLGPGAVIVDLARRESVPMAEISAELDSWRREMDANHRPVALKKIYVFGGGELREFDRQVDGSYAPAIPAALPFAPIGASQRNRVFTRPPSNGTALSSALAVAELEKELKRLMKKGRYAAVLRVWEDFTVTAEPGDVAWAERKLNSLLKSAEAKVENPKPRYYRGQ
jgi:hypothetical protein